MDWMLVVEEIFKLIIFPVLSIGGIYLTYLITVKINELKQKTDNEMADKYLTILNNSICDAVLTTTQTYVEALKKEGKFDAEAQKVAFEKTYNAVISILSAEAKEYLTNIYGDLSVYIMNMIEAEVNRSKLPK
jgi:hypothetical protein